MFVTLFYVIEGFYLEWDTNTQYRSSIILEFNMSLNIKPAEVQLLRYIACMFYILVFKFNVNRVCVNDALPSHYSTCSNNNNLVQFDGIPLLRGRVANNVIAPDDTPCVMMAKLNISSCAPLHNNFL